MIYQKYALLVSFSVTILEEISVLDCLFIDSSICGEGLEMEHAV